MTVTVVGVSTHSALGPEALDALAQADLLVGSAANLALAGAPSGTPRIELGPLAPALDRLREHNGKAVVVAAGDPGFFGIVRALRTGTDDLRVLPAVSSVAAAAALAGVSWDAAVVVSAHGRNLAPAVNACRAFGLVAVLTGPGAGPVEIAQALAGWPRELIVVERLGMPGERVTRAPAEEIAQHAPFADPNVVLCTAPDPGSTMRADNQPAAAPAAGWALDESAYAHRDSMITKAEVRAYVVARLRPRLGRLVLDLGCGSGSVGVECAALGAAVIGVDRDAEACRLTADNAERHRVRLRVVAGDAADVLPDLPGADAAFVGGGGVATVEAVTARRIPTVVAAFAALDTAIGAHRVLTAAGYRVEGTHLSASRLTDLPGGSLRLAATNPVVVLTGEIA